VIDAIEKRRSIRKYRKRPIPQRDLMELLDAARIAPSAANRQPWQMIVIQDELIKTELVPMCKDQGFIADCSAFLVGIDDPTQKSAKVDLVIAFDHITLAAVEKGLGTCWIGAFDNDAVAKHLMVPEPLVVTVCMAVGYPAEDPGPRHRKDMESLFHWEQYGGRR